MALPLAFLEELRNKTSLPSLIGRSMKLTRSGKQWKACCPFHSESTPSFYVYDDGFHCFGCGAHGDALAFLMRSQGLNFNQAVKTLAIEANFEMPDSRATVERGSPFIKVDPGFKVASLEDILATAARLLVRNRNVKAASILANAGGRLDLQNHDNWNGGTDTWRLTLTLPAEVYFDLYDREGIEKQIDASLGTTLSGISNSDFIEAKIATALDQDPLWRAKITQHVSGEGITNQGRVRSDNVAAREHDGLLFRSKPEIYFYDALKRTGIPFAPLSVILRGAEQYRRVEPDFVIFKDGMVMIVEIDGDLYHSETPAAAHERLRFITSEGAKLERIEAKACDTPEKAREAVRLVIAAIEKHRLNR